MASDKKQTTFSHLYITNMSKFVIDNEYEWGFLFFRALAMNAEYSLSFIDCNPPEKREQF